MLRPRALDQRVRSSILRRPIVTTNPRRSLASVRIDDGDSPTHGVAFGFVATLRKGYAQSPEFPYRYVIDDPAAPVSTLTVTVVGVAPVLVH